MKHSIRSLIGKNITGIIVKQGGPVKQQVFLLFSDDTYFEFYSSERMGYSGALSIGDANTVREYMADAQKIVIDEIWSEAAA
ncbi:MAG: hypothetical protein ACSLFQ_09575 [Thermoanaerobaculia bacterium]